MRLSSKFKPNNLGLAVSINHNQLDAAAALRRLPPATQIQPPLRQCFQWTLNKLINPYFFPNSSLHLEFEGDIWVFEKSPRSKLFKLIQRVRTGTAACCSTASRHRPPNSSHISGNFSGNSFGTNNFFGEFNSFFPFLLPKLKLTPFEFEGDVKNIMLGYLLP